MAWTHYTSALSSSDGVISKAQWEELWEAVRERRLMAGLTMPSTPRTLERPGGSSIWKSYIAPMYYLWAKSESDPSFWTEAEIIAEAESRLGHAINLQYNVWSSDYFNLCRIACDLFTVRRLLPSYRRLFRRFGAAGGRGSFYSGGPVGSSNLGDARVVMSGRFDPDGISPEDNPESISPSISEWPLLARYYTCEQNHAPTDDTYRSVLSVHMRESFLQRYSIPTAMRGEAITLKQTLRLWKAHADNSYGNNEAYDVDKLDWHADTDNNYKFYFSGRTIEADPTFGFYLDGVEIDSPAVTTTFSEFTLASDHTLGATLELEVFMDVVPPFPPTIGSQSSKLHFSETHLERESYDLAIAVGHLFTHSGDLAV